MIDFVTKSFGKRITENNEISYISAVFELRRFEMIVDDKGFYTIGLQIQVYI